MVTLSYNNHHHHQIHLLMFTLATFEVMCWICRLKLGIDMKLSLVTQFLVLSASGKGIAIDVINKLKLILKCNFDI
jgi:hypothetical protein